VIGRMAPGKLPVWIIGAVPKLVGRETGRCPWKGQPGTISRVTNSLSSLIIRTSQTESGVGWEAGYKPLAPSF
jgi:hypothetical protein